MTTKKSFIISAVSIAVCVLSLVIFRIYKKSTVVALPAGITQSLPLETLSMPEPSKEEKAAIADRMKKNAPAVVPVPGLQHPNDPKKMVLAPEAVTQQVAPNGLPGTAVNPQPISPKIIAEHEGKMKKFSNLSDKERLEKTKENLSYIKSHATKDRLLMINPALLKGEVSLISNMVYQVQLEDLRADLEQTKQQKKH